MIAGLALLGLTSTGAVAQVPRINGGPGILLAGSCDRTALPENARKFLDSHFKNDPVSSCMHDYASALYEVKLSDGVEIEFGNDGKVVEIEAPDNKCLSQEVVKEVVNDRTYRRLEKDGVAGNVESIDFAKGRVVEVELAISGPDTYVFDLDGNLIVIED